MGYKFNAKGRKHRGQPWINFLVSYSVFLVENLASDFQVYPYSSDEVYASVLVRLLPLLCLSFFKKKKSDHP